MPYTDVSDQDEKAIVLRHLMRRQHLMDAVADFVKESGYFGNFSQFAFLFEVLYDYWKTCRRLPGRDVYLHQLAVFLDQFEFTESDRNTSTYIAENLYAVVDFSDAFVEYVLTQERNEFEARRISGKLEMRQTPEEVGKLVRDAHQRLTLDPFRKLTVSTAFNDIIGNMEDIQRFKLGLDFADAALDGDLAIGESALFIAPSGGGKTTLGFQFSEYQVRQHMPVVYFHTEQPQKGDLAIRQYVLATGGTRGDFAKGYHCIPPERLERLNTVRKLWIDNFYFVDCRNADILHIEELFRPIDELKKAGVHPKLIILDWWGRLRNRLLVQAANRDDTMNRIMAQEWLFRLINGVKERDSRLVVLHQTRGAAARKGVRAMPSSHDAQEDSNLNNLFEFGFAMSKLNAQNRCSIVVDKARSTGRTSGYLALDGEHCLFKGCSDPAYMDDLEESNVPAANSGTVETYN